MISKTMFRMVDEIHARKLEFWSDNPDTLRRSADLTYREEGGISWLEGNDPDHYETLGYWHGRVAWRIERVCMNCVTSAEKLR